MGVAFYSTKQAKLDFFLVKMYDREEQRVAIEQSQVLRFVWGI